VTLFSLLKKDDRTKQLVYYQAGIGTYTSPQIATPMASSISKVTLFTSILIYSVLKYHSRVVTIIRNTFPDARRNVRLEPGLSCDGSVRQIYL
jgi:hypothetical protein